MDWAQLVQEIVEEARRTAGSGPALAALLEDAGVGPEAGRYSESGISNWIKGRTMPPGDVLLATASVGHISLDQKLTQADAAAEDRSESTEITQLRQELEDLRRQHGRLEALLIDLYSRTGQTYPHNRPDENQRGPRAAGGA